MLFPRATIIGIGLIGGSFALATKRAGLVGEVIGVARSESTRSLALERGAADRVTGDVAEAVRGADLVYLATPISAILSLLPQIGPHLAPAALVTDAGSTKVEIVAAARALPSSVYFLGGHPMAGSEQAGIAAARADLFEGSTYLLTPTPDTPEEAVLRLAELAREIGARPVLVDPETHDRLVAVTSHLPHLLAWALCAAAAETNSPDRLSSFTAGAWRDTTRIADSPEEVWADIFLTNREHLMATALRFSERWGDLLRLVALGDREGLIAFLRESREAHRRIGEA
jgi:prephenate dehydrogenase